MERQMCIFGSMEINFPFSWKPKQKQIIQNKYNGERTIHFVGPNGNWDSHSEGKQSRSLSLSVCDMATNCYTILLLRELFIRLPFFVSPV